MGSVLQRNPGFSRARTLLQRAGNGTSALAGTGEAGVLDAQPNDSAVLQATEAIKALQSVDLIEVRKEPARSGSFGTWPDRLDHRLLAALEQTQRPRPYTHQEIALRALHARRNTVLATSTASGKSLCYQVPIIDAVLGDRTARALMLFPTKALGRDQVESLRELVARIDAAAVGVAVYDGDTPPDARRAARRAAHVVATNPDMLHRGILPNHERWARFLAGLRYIVVDELHVYRGLFGSHVACVLRRLLRLCRHYGASPRIVACSATIANPGELAETLCGAPFLVVDANTAPTGPRTTLLLNPRVVDDTTGVRRDYLKVTRGIASVLRRLRVQTLTFCRTRKAVELITRYMQDDERKERERSGHYDPARVEPSAIRGYRGGYLPERRREVEAALRDGSARMVAATNALELGIDIGGVDAVVLSGYPGTRAATWQRLGRAGRRTRPALGVIILSSIPLDQFVAADPGFLWGHPPEHARIDPDNPDILLPHLRCAAHELAFGPNRIWEGLPAEELDAALTYLAEPEQGALVRADSDSGSVFAPTTNESPTESVDLRGSIEENFAVIDQHSGDILAEVDFEDAALYLHPGAIYAIEGKTHEVLDLQWDARKAMVRQVNADYYTEAVSKTRVRVIELDTEGVGSSGSSTVDGPQSSGPRAHSGALTPASGQGLAHLVHTVPGFKKIRFGTHENIGFGPVNLPDLELHTTAAYWAYPSDDRTVAADPVRRAATALAVGHALHHVAAMVLMCDIGDLGHVVTAGHPSSWGAVIRPGRKPSFAEVLAGQALPYIVLYDLNPGGAGLATTAEAMGAALLDRVANTVSGCGCEQGCPVCMGPSSDDGWEVQRTDVVEVLAALSEQVAAQAAAQVRLSGRVGSA